MSAAAAAVSAAAAANTWETNKHLVYRKRCWRGLGPTTYGWEDLRADTYMLGGCMHAYKLLGGATVLRSKGPARLALPGWSCQ